MGESKDKGLVVLVVGVILVIILIWFLSQRKDKKGDGDDDDPGRQAVKPSGPSLTWYDYISRPRLEAWIGYPGVGHWVRLEHRLGFEMFEESWHFWIFPDPGGDPYTKAGRQIGIGGSKITLGEVQTAVQNSWRANDEYPESIQWLNYMVSNVLDMEV